MHPYREPIFSLWRPLLVVISCMLVPVGVVLADKVREVVVRFDDGTEQVIAVAAARPPAPVPSPNTRQPVPPPPTDGPMAVTVATPMARTVATAPAYFVIRANVTGGGGQVQKVELYAGDKLLDAPTAPPFMAEWSDV